MAHAKREVLRLSDFPSGWTSSPIGSKNQKSQVGAVQIASCLGVPVKTLVANPPQATRPEFDQTTQELSVSEQVAELRAAAGSKADFEAIANPKAPACLSKYLNSALTTTPSTSGVTTGQFTVSRLPFPTYGARSTALTLTLPVTDNGTTVNTTLDVVVIRQGRGQLRPGRRSRSSCVSGVEGCSADCLAEE